MRSPGCEHVRVPSRVPVVLERLTASFAAHGDPERATAMSAYMRNQFPFLGIPTPERRRIGRAVVEGLGVPGEKELSTIARAVLGETRTRVSVLRL